MVTLRIFPLSIGIISEICFQSALKHFENEVPFPIFILQQILFPVRQFQNGDSVSILSN